MVSGRVIGRVRDRVKGRVRDRFGGSYRVRGRDRGRVKGRERGRERGRVRWGDNPGPICSTTYFCDWVSIRTLPECPRLHPAVGEDKPPSREGHSKSTGPS